MYYQYLKAIFLEKITCNGLHIILIFLIDVYCAPIKAINLQFLLVYRDGGIILTIS